MAKERTRPDKDARQDVAPQVADDDDELDPRDQQIPITEYPASFQKAYNRAVNKGCSDKAARLYAEAHSREYSDDGSTQISEEDIDRQIARLEAMKSELAS